MSKIEQYPISLNNSLTGNKELFKSIHPEYVGIYVCGPTVYSDVHLGNVRTFMNFDVIYRYLQFLGYKVRYVRNITDVGHLENDADEGEDKIAKKARLEQLEPMEIVQHYTNGFHDVLKKFNILPPSIEPSATGHIMEQIEMIETLLEKGFAYEVNGSVYFDVNRYDQQHNYGILSNRKLEELRESGRMLDSQEEKRDKVDFALWKKASPKHIMRWKSPWGEGFPGWHLECTVMSTKYLGDTFDIHGGGMDLKFPHHDCEIAQSVGSKNCQPANYWLHTNMLTVNGKKMSKSLGNSFLPEELFSGNHELLDHGYSPMVVRFFMLQCHYSSTLDFSMTALDAAEKGYKKLMVALKAIKVMDHHKGQVDDALDKEITQLLGDCYRHMSDDFNTARTLATLFELTSRINELKHGALHTGQLQAATFQSLKETFVGIIENVLGLQIEEEGNNGLLKSTIEMLITIRKKAKEDRNYALSDQIRDELKEKGIVLMDGKGGETTYNLA